MATDEQAFLRRLLATFKQEADDHLKTMADSLRTLADPGQAGRAAELGELLFREAHSLKGAARSVDMGPVEILCHALESVLARLRAREIALSTRLLDVLLQVLDRLAQDVEAGVAGKPAGDSSALREALLAAAEHAEPVAETAPEAASPSPPTPASEFEAADTVRISSAKLMRMFEQVEEMSAFAFAAGRMAQELRSLHAMIADWERELWEVNANVLNGNLSGAEAARQIQEGFASRLQAQRK